MKKRDDRILDDIRNVLDEQCNELSTDTRSRLANSRHRAVQHTRKNRLEWQRMGWKLLPVAASVMLMFAGYHFLSPFSIRDIQSSDLQSSDLHIVTDQESLGFYQEDLAFYEWVQEMYEVEGLPDSGSSDHIPIRNGSIAAGIEGSGKERARDGSESTKS